MGLLSWFFPTPEVRLERAIKRGVVHADKFNFNQPHLAQRLQRRNFSGVRFVGAFKHCQFTGSSFTRCNFRKAALAGADFTATNLRRTDFRDCHMRGTKLHDTLVEHCDLRNAILHDASIQSSVFHETDLRAADLTNLRARDATFRGVTTDKDTVAISAELQRCRFEPSEHKPSVIAGDWRAAHMPRAQISANIAGCNLSAASLEGARLTDCTLRNTNLTDTKLDRAHFERCHLHRVQFPADVNSANDASHAGRGQSITATDCTQLGLDPTALQRLRPQPRPNNAQHNSPAQAPTGKQLQPLRGRSLVRPQPQA